jgi:hypothetical protein
VNWIQLAKDGVISGFSRPRRLIFKCDTNPQHAFLLRGSETVNPIYNFTVCKTITKQEQRYFEDEIHKFLLQVPPDLLLDDSAGRIAIELWWTNEEFPLPITFHRGSPCSYIIWELKNRPTGGYSSEM